MDYLGASPLRPLLRLMEKAFRQHRARLDENEAWRSFDEASHEALAGLGFFHARDLARDYAEEAGPRAHWAHLAHFFEETARATGDFSFTACLASQLSALELWRRLQGEEVSFTESGEVIAFAPGRDPAGLGRLDETFLVGAACLVPNAPRASHFITRVELRGEPALVAFARDEAVLTADLTGTLNGFWTGSAGELALHGAEVLPDDIKLTGAGVDALVEETLELERLLLASAALGVLKSFAEESSFPLLRVKISLEGISELQREACYEEEPRRLRDLLAVSQELLAAEIPAALREEGSFFAAKLKRDLEAARDLYPNAAPAAATSKPASQAG